jgi:DNA-binding FadR family transcriptional regulator
MQFESLNKITLTEQIMQQLAAKITSGELKPGDKIPPERQLSEQLNVSRSRVREALRALSLIGMITITPGGGTYVSESEDIVPEETVIWVYRQELHNVHDIYDARELIESAVYLTCFDNNDGTIVPEMRNLMNAIIRESVTDCSAEDFNRLLVNLDMFAAQHCKNSIFAKLIQTMILLRRGAALRTLSYPELRRTSATKRNKIVEAFEMRNRKALEKALRQFFEKSRKDFELAK